MHELPEGQKARSVGLGQGDEFELLIDNSRAKMCGELENRRGVHVVCWSEKSPAPRLLAGTGGTGPGGGIFSSGAGGRDGRSFCGLVAALLLSLRIDDIIFLRSSTFRREHLGQGLGEFQDDNPSNRTVGVVGKEGNVHAGHERRAGEEIRVVVER